MQGRLVAQEKLVALGEIVAVVTLTVDTTFGSGSAFTLTVPLAVPSWPAEKLEERFGADVSAVRAFSVADPA